MKPHLKPHSAPSAHSTFIALLEALKGGFMMIYIYIIIHFIVVKPLEQAIHNTDC